MPPVPGEPQLMAHGYTNRTVRTGAIVTKDYQGPDAAIRCATEAAALAGLAGQVPVPRVLYCQQTWLVTACSLLRDLRGAATLAGSTSGDHGQMRGTA